MLYAWSAPAHILSGDNAEMAALGKIGGAAHPTGYPLYLLWLRLWSLLPFGTPAHAAAIATAVIGAAQLFVLHAALRAWGARPAAASLAVAMYAAAPIVMRLHTQAEVFALNGLVCATLLWLAADRGPVRGEWRATALGLVAGLGLANHVTCVLLAPVGLLGVVRGLREADRRSLVACGATLGLFAGLLPYLYLLATPETAASWGKVEGLHGLVRHFLREDYGGAGAFSPRAEEVSVATSLAAFAETLGRTWLWLPALLGLGTFGWMIARPTHETRAAWIALAASWLLAGPLLAARFNIVPTGYHLYVVQRFHVLPALLLAIPVAVGLDRVCGRLFDRLGLLRTTAIAVAGLVLGAARVLPQIGHVQSPAVERALENMLSTLPPDAIVIVAPDEVHFGLAYLQGARGMRPDVATVSTPQLGLSQYRDRIRRKTGVTIERAGGDEKQTVKLAEQLLATGRPVFIDPYQGNIARAFPSYPYGLLSRILPLGTPAPAVTEVFAINKELYARYRFGYPTPGLHDELATQWHVNYARVWHFIAAGLTDPAQREQRAYAQQLEYALGPEQD